MNIKRLAIGSVVGTIVLYLLGMLFWIYLFAEFFADNSGSATGVQRLPMITWALIVGTLLYGALLTLALEWRGSKSVMDGLVTGAIVGALLWGCSDFTHYAITNVNTLTGTIADTVLEAVRAGITGAVVAFVLGKVGD